MSTSTFLSRKIDYLGDLGAKLRDLQGFRTLAHELIQNADDVPNATHMVFDIRDGALLVDNDGVFSDCNHVEDDECPWKADDSKGYRCDFHRFRHIAAGDKRGEADTTGAFGIGFIAVYQITDIPELISNGRHWILHEDSREEDRIEICQGCPTCTSPDLPGTRFILPWALNPQSRLRIELKANAISKDSPENLLKELVHSLPVAMLFLKLIRTIEVKRNGRRFRSFERLDEGDSLIITTGNANRDRIWHLVHGNFSESAKSLRERNVGRIENKRSSEVTIAIPEYNEEAGLLCACLPTEQDTKLPFYINADFFPTSDRKRVLFDDDYQSEWNRAALSAAAQAIGDHIDQLPSLLGAQRLWKFLETIKAVHDDDEHKQREGTLGEFWKAIEPRLRTSKVIQTTQAKWVYSSEAVLLLQKEEAPIIPILEVMGLNVVNERLRPFLNLLRAEVVGIPLLDITRICQVFNDFGLAQRTKPDECPPFLVDNSARIALWREIELLLDRQQRSPSNLSEDVERLKKIAIAPGYDRTLWPGEQLYSAEKSTIALFREIDPSIPFIAEDPEFKRLAGRLCQEFTATKAIDWISSMDPNALAQGWREGRIGMGRLFGWFEDHRPEILGSGDTKEAFALMKIFPSSGTLRELGDLFLPGDFEDHLGLAELVDLPALGGRREFIRDLGMRELDFRTYVGSLLPIALKNPSVPSEKRRDVVKLLAERIGEIKDDPKLREAVTTSPLIECNDGEFRHSMICYFESQDVRECLGRDVYFVVAPSDSQTAFIDLYKWLGVTDQPRLNDLLDRIEVIASTPCSPGSAKKIGNIFAHLGHRFRGKEELQELAPLQNTAWLLAKGKADRWYRPGELYASYQAHLFGTQAFFLDISHRIQIESQPLLEFLGINLTPTPDLVVKHLLFCAHENLSVNNDVYRFLNDKADDPAVELLKEKKCLLHGRNYLAPNQVFWGEHPFGRYRWRLSEDLRAYGKLLQRIGVLEAPDYREAAEVLREICDEFGHLNAPLDDEVYAILVMCWSMLSESLDKGLLPRDEPGKFQGVKCIPDGRKILNPPEWMFFENRAGLASKFKEFIKDNVIPRPLGASSAMEAAGVRPLGSAVEIQLLDYANPNTDLEIKERIISRRGQFARVLESQIQGGEVTSALGRLETIRYEEVSSLLIRYALKAFNRHLESEPEEVPAHYRQEDEILFFMRRNGTVPWAALARELAIALFPEEDPGRIAAPLKEVLAAESFETAEATLDELGFARLDYSVSGAPQPTSVIGTLGDEKPTAEDILREATERPTLPVEPPDLPVGEAIKLMLGPGATAPTPPQMEVPKDPPSFSTGSGSGVTHGSSKKKGRPVLRSYLPSPDSAEAITDSGDSSEQQNRSSVDEAGIRRVMEYERQCGRKPKEMPHTNPGYDIESCDSSGIVIRYIEVKSFSGQWKDTYADLSRTQFDKAGRLGEAFWLYVVERAESDDYQVFRIQNPALIANHFMFDDGWRATAEPEYSEKEGQ